MVTPDRVIAWAEWLRDAAFVAMAATIAVGTFCFAVLAKSVTPAWWFGPGMCVAFGAAVVLTVFDARRWWRCRPWAALGTTRGALFALPPKGRKDG